MHALSSTRTVRIAAIVAAAVVLVAIACAFWLGAGKALDARHRPLAFVESFDYANGNFADYLAWSERRLRAAHPQADAAQLAELGPFRLAPGASCPAGNARNGVVLTHDLLDSPYTMRALAAYFEARCFVVYGLMLPGHGTQPGDLLNTDWEEWAAAQRFAARALAGEVDNLYFAGHGVGATLAIYEAASNADVDGLVLIAPDLKASAGWRSRVAGALGWIMPSARWAEVVPTYSPYRYDSLPYRMAAEVAALGAAVDAALPQRPFEVPVFSVVSMEDADVDTQAALAYMAERAHPLSATVIFSAEQLPPQPPRTGVVISHLPEVQLLSLSHRALVIPAEDPEFGWEGRSRDCGHYHRGEPENYQRCMAGERTVRGETSAENLAAGLLERATSNPFYWDLIRVLDGFFAPVAAATPDIQPR